MKYNRLVIKLLVASVDSSVTFCINSGLLILSSYCGKPQFTTRAYNMKVTQYHPRCDGMIADGLFANPSLFETVLFQFLH